MQAEAIARRVVVHGRVQGVFFRASTREKARVHGLVGWVRNRPDGAVEAWLEGPAEHVTALLAWIEDGGPRHAVVERVEHEEVPPAGHAGFAVRR